ncbi:MAG: hypothetical protein AAFN18_08715 [Cyanobacteria bacterium J06554_6]
MGYCRAAEPTPTNSEALTAMQLREQRHGEIVRLIRQLRQRSEIGPFAAVRCRSSVPPPDTLDIRVLPKMLAALAAKRSSRPKG